MRASSPTRRLDREAMSDMMNRRVFAASAAAAILVGPSRGLAATYDLIIRGGRVIDPSVSLDAVRDVAVEKATRQGLWPDTFSTDWNTKSKTSGVVDLPNVMSKLLMFGM